MARDKDFDLATALAQKSFTPGRRDVPGLVTLVAAGDQRAAPALAPLEEARGALVDALAAITDEGARANLAAALGLVARRGDADAIAVLVALLGDAQPRARRAAISALGKLPPASSSVAALQSRWDHADTTEPERRALVDALGKLGGDSVLARLRALDPGADKELARRRDRAVLVADRDARREDASDIAIDVVPAAPLAIRLTCRAGLSTLLADSCREHGFADVRSLTDRTVDLTLVDRPWAALHAVRLWVTAGIRVPLLAGSSDVDAIARTIVAQRPLFAAWTRGAIRWRLGFADGHRRAVVWNVAREVARLAPELLNDPTQTTWDILVDDRDRPGALELIPRRAADPRFAWRVADVPAASHPTIAAALARVATVRPTDTVWDPFCGSGAELVERALLGPHRALIATDLDPRALDAARANFAAAQLAPTIALADARTADGPPIDLIITNPPLGSRVHVDAAALLVDCLPHFARRLTPGGRLVWITPALRRTTPALEALRLGRVVSFPVDLGGVRGHLERWDKLR